MAGRCPVVPGRGHALVDSPAPYPPACRELVHERLVKRVASDPNRPHVYKLLHMGSQAHMGRGGGRLAPLWPLMDSPSEVVFNFHSQLNSRHVVTAETLASISASQSCRSFTLPRSTRCMFTRLAIAIIGVAPQAELSRRRVHSWARTGVGLLLSQERCLSALAVRRARDDAPLRAVGQLALQRTRGAADRRGGCPPMKINGPVGSVPHEAA